MMSPSKRSDAQTIDDFYSDTDRLEEDIYSLAKSGFNPEQLLDLQERLDAIDLKYKDSTAFSNERYKLYELQSLIHYYAGKDVEALIFINDAVTECGYDYDKAKEIKALISQSHHSESVINNQENMSLSEKRKLYIGLEGWLAFFIVGLMISLVLSLFNLFSSGLGFSESEITTLNEYQYGLGDSTAMLGWVENFAVVLYIALVITTLTLLFKKSKISKTFAISTLIFGAVYGVVDLAVVYSLYGSTDLMQVSEFSSYIDKYARDVGRSLAAAAVWIPYFLVSMRVKATLVR